MVRFFLFFMLVMLMGSCTKRQEVHSFDVKTKVETDYSPEKYLFVRELNTKDRVVFFYQDQEGYTHYYNGKEDRIINREVMDKYKKMGAVPMSFSYAFDGKYLYFSQPVRWGPKKLILIKMEPDGKVLYTKELSYLEQVLRPASFAFDGKGNMLLSWIDETPPYVKAAYLLVKEDNFPKKEEVISFEENPILSVRSLYTGKGFALLYTKAGKGGKGSEVRIRFLYDGNEKVLYSGDGSTDFDFYEYKEGFVLRPYELSQKVKVIVYDRTFEKKKEYTIDKPKDISNTFDIIQVGLFRGVPLLLGAGIPPVPVKVDDLSLPQKLNTFYSYDGSTFERLVGGKPFMFTSTLPSYDSSDKYALVAYEDRRLTAPTVMASLIDSKGKLVKRDILLEKPWVTTGSPKVVYLGEDTFRVFYPVEDRKDKVWIYRAKDIKADGIDSLYDLPKPDKDLLMKTVNKYTECRKNNDYKCTYSMLDPTYRTVISEEMHKDMMKKINAKISDYRLENCKVLENSVLAACDGYIKARLPQEIMGKPIKEQERNVEQKIRGNIWVYIDGKWYYAVDLPMLGYALQW
ncbi:MAG: hypothetical protein ACK4SM_05390 [Aquificaceae bacterium]